MDVKKTILLVCGLLLVLFSGYELNDDISIKILDEIFQGNSDNLDKIDEVKKIEKIEEVQNMIYNLEENVSIKPELVFCKYNNCEEFVVNIIRNTTTKIKCAFYELDNIEVIDSFKYLNDKGVDIEILVDDRYLNESGFVDLKKLDNIKIYSDKKRGTRYNNYMHDKFCIIDDDIFFTGSANPTETGLVKNNNNILKFESKYLVQNYDREFEQMKSGVYGTNKKSVLKYNNLTMNYQNLSYKISTYFCPQDDCLTPVLDVLDSAENEILFASFAFTNDDIVAKLKMKKYQGVNVSGVMESRSKGLKGSDYEDMKDSFNLVLDKNKNTMHHKFFVVDGRYIITGSMNPTGSGVKYNDENIIIIENVEMAQRFREEFLRLSE